MKSLKIYIGVVLVLLTLGIGLGVYVWYTLQTLETVVPTEVTSPNDTKNDPATQPPSTKTDAEPTIIEVEALPQSQQKILEGFGYTQDSVTITPAMMECAQKSLTNERIAEILGGSAPTPIESLKLLPCFKK